MFKEFEIKVSTYITAIIISYKLIKSKRVRTFIKDNLLDDWSIIYLDGDNQSHKLNLRKSIATLSGSI